MIRVLEINSYLTPEINSYLTLGINSYLTLSTVPQDDHDLLPLLVTGEGPHRCCSVPEWVSGPGISTRARVTHAFHLLEVAVSVTLLRELTVRQRRERAWWNRSSNSRNI